MNKLFNKKTSAVNVRQLITGMITTAIIAFALSLVAPIFIKNEYCKQEYIWLVAMIIHALSVAVGILVSGILPAEKQLITPMVISGTWFLLMLCSGMVFLGGGIEHVLTALGGCIIGGSFAVFVQFHSKRSNLRAKKGSGRRPLYKMTNR